MMRRLTLLCAVLLLWSPLVGAQGALVAVDGEPFAKRHVAAPPNGDRLLEFVRDSESFEAWTKLVGFRSQRLPGIANDPLRMASVMAQQVKAANPQAQSQIIVNSEKNEAILDFLIWPAGGKFLEFNVFRFMKSQDGLAVVSLQLAHRFMEPSAITPESFARIRQSWLKKAVEFDMRSVAHALAAPLAR